MKLTKTQKEKIKQVVDDSGDYLDDVLNAKLLEILEDIPEVVGDEDNEQVFSDGVAYARAVFFNYDLDKIS